MDNTNTTEEKNDTPTIKSVFVSGIPYETTEDDIRQIFEECGIITEIKMPRYQDSGKNRGYAHVSFKKNSHVKKALEKNGVTVGKRYLTVEMSKGETNAPRKVDFSEVPEDCCTIMIKNLSYDTTEKELGDKFKPCGAINSIRMVYHSKLGHFKGFAFIDFEQSESVKIALNLNGKELKGRKMLVDFEDAKPKAGFKFRSTEPSKFNKEYNEILHKKRKRDN